MRYFISYTNLKNNSDLDKDIDIYSSELKLMNKKQQDVYTILPLYVFAEHILDLESFIHEIENKRSNISIMVELNEEDAKKVHPIFLKRFKNNKLLNPDKSIRLLDKDVINYMNYKEVSSGRIINLTPDDNASFTLSTKKIEKNTNNYRIGEGEYFYTEVERTLEKYKDKIVEIEEVKRDKYKIKKHKLIIIDSVGQDRTIGLSKDSYEFLYKVCFTSKPIYITGDEYESKIFTSPVNNSKKAYILENENIDTLIFNSSIKPLFKYINIYELEDGVYKKTSLQTYAKENVLTKKPNID